MPLVTSWYSSSDMSHVDSENSISDLEWCYATLSVAVLQKQDTNNCQCLGVHGCIQLTLTPQAPQVLALPHSQTCSSSLQHRFWQSWVVFERRSCSLVLPQDYPGAGQCQPATAWDGTVRPTWPEEGKGKREQRGMEGGRKGGRDWRFLICWGPIPSFALK